MNNLHINNSFSYNISSNSFIRSKGNYRSIAFKSKTKCSEKLISKPTFWDRVEIFLHKKIQKQKNKPFSQNIEIRKIEQNLAQNGVNVRFNNNYELANYINSGIECLKKANIKELPTNILFTSPLISFLGIKGLTYKFNKNIKESPIILPRNVYKLNKNQSESKSKFHTLFHETGHWLHFQNDFDVYKNVRIWDKYADLEFIKNQVSDRAIAVNDGSEFCAEVFAMQMVGKKFPTKILNLVKKLNGYVLEK